MFRGLGLGFRVWGFLFSDLGFRGSGFSWSRGSGV